MSEKKFTEQEQKAYDYCDDAAKDLECDPTSGKAMRVAVVRLILDEANITDQAERNRIAKAYFAMPNWFGCNASQGKQARGIKSQAVSTGLEDLEA